jgi:hypothetical protein
MLTTVVTHPPTCRLRVLAPISGGRGSLPDLGGGGGDACGALGGGSRSRQRGCVHSSRRRSSRCCRGAAAAAEASRGGRYYSVRGRVWRKGPADGASPRSCSAACGAVAASVVRGRRRGRSPTGAERENGGTEGPRCRRERGWVPRWGGRGAVGMQMNR